jgi:hypothetical protein
VALRLDLTGPRAAPKRVDLGALVRRVIDETLGRIESVTVPGEHAGGISNKDLFAVLAAQGRPFLALNRPLMAWLRTKLQVQYDGASYLPGGRELEERVTALVRERVQNRMVSQGLDVRVRGLTPRYAKAKAKAGYGDRPVGIRTGKLLESVLKLDVEFG